jgi:hypothetical protein
MMEKLAQDGEGGGCTPSPCHFMYHQVQSCGVPYAPLFLLLPYVYSMSLPQEKPTSKGTNREPSLVLSVSESLAVRFFYWQLDDDKCHIASPVPRIYGTIWGLPDLPKFWLISPLSLALFL